jgi:hypothetical protein
MSKLFDVGESHVIQKRKSSTIKDKKRDETGLEAFLELMSGLEILRPWNQVATNAKLLLISQKHQDWMNNSIQKIERRGSTASSIETWGTVEMKLVQTLFLRIKPGSISKD